MATYTVRKGDTLSAIARAYNTTVHALMRLNPDITNKNVIRVGQLITLPGPVKVEPAKDYAAIGQQMEKCIAAIENLPEFIKLEGMLYGDGH